LKRTTKIIAKKGLAWRQKKTRRGDAEAKEDPEG
jgi:hypothetical protein